MRAEDILVRIFSENEDITETRILWGRKAENDILLMLFEDENIR